MACALLMLAGCSAGGGANEANQTANQPANQGNMASAPSRGPGQRCGPIEYENGCADVSPTSERMRGIWVWGDSDRSGFIPDATVAPRREDGQSRHVFLIFERDFPDDAAVAARASRGGTAAYAIDFVGRRTRRPGAFGYRGEAQNLVIVERINSLRVLEWPE
jgi:hypothetical protein